MSTTEDDKKEEVEIVECEFCHGEGIIVTDEDDGEGNVRFGVGSRRCICRTELIDHDHDDD